MDGGGVARQVAVENAWLHGPRLVLKFAGIDTISDAEKLRGLSVCIPRSERPAAAEGEYYFQDLIGCAMVDDTTGEPVGPVTGWSQTGAVPLLEVAGPHGEVLVPFAREILSGVDLGARCIRVRLPEGLLDLNS
jgi:16S rRNA processing protein RimM